MLLFPVTSMECCCVWAASHIKNVTVRSASKINCYLQPACACADASVRAAQLDLRGGKSAGQNTGEGARGGIVVFFSAVVSSCDCASHRRSGPHRDTAAAIVHTQVFNIQTLVLLGVYPSWAVMRLPVPIQGEVRSCLLAAFLPYWSCDKLNSE